MELETQQPAIEPAAPVAAPEAAPTPAPEAAPQAPEKPLERREVIAAAIKASQEPANGKTLRERMIENGTIRPRDQQGRFAPQQAQPATAKPSQAAAPARPADGVPSLSPSSSPATASDVPLPRSLKKELEAHWKAANPELQRAIAQREADFERGATQWRQQAEAANQLLAEFKPYEPMMRLTGATPVSAIRSILPTMAVLNTGSPAEKAFVVAKTLQQFGIPLEHIQQVMQGGVHGIPQAALDPTVQALQQQVQSLTQTFQQREQAQRAAEDARYQAIADSWGHDKPHFESLRPQMWSLLQAQATAEQNGIQGPLGSREQTAAWSEQQWVENAYNATIRLNPELYQSELTRQREEAARAERDRATQAALASRAAAVQVRGAPSPVAGTGSIDPKDRRAVISAALRARA